MRRSLLLTVFLSLVMLVPHGGALAIVYGVPDDGHPYVGAFVATVRDPETGQESLVRTCTGTLIDEDLVLSASHCFVDIGDLIGLEILDMAFTLAPVVDEDQDGVVDADVPLLSGEAVTHEKYLTAGYANPYDIAVFRLDQEVTTVQPARLAPARTLADRAVRDETFVVVGYGTTRETRTTSHQAFGVGWRRMMAEQHVLSINKVWATFSMNQATGNGGTCYGDSGGPHLLHDVVVSVTITGDVPCKATDRTYRIDTPWAREFLSRFVTLP